MTDYNPSFEARYGSPANWDYREMDLDVVDLDIIVAALWVAHRNTQGWANHPKSRVDELRRFFNQARATFGQVTLWTLAVPGLPPESP